MASARGPGRAEHRRAHRQPLPRGCQRAVLDLTATGTGRPMRCCRTSTSCLGNQQPARQSSPDTSQAPATRTASGPWAGDSAGLHAGSFEADFEGGYANHVLTATHMEPRQSVRGARRCLRHDYHRRHGPRLDLRGLGQFPLAPGRARPAGAQRRRHFQISGVLPYRVHVTGEASAATLPEIPVDITVSLAKDRFSFRPRRGRHVRRTRSASGEVVWAAPGTWSITGRATGIDPGAAASGSARQSQFQLQRQPARLRPRGEPSATFANLSGKLRGVSASGQRHGRTQRCQRSSSPTCASAWAPRASRSMAASTSAWTCSFAVAATI